ncbi:MAG: S8 family serine peptidase [bacterium]
MINFINRGRLKLFLTIIFILSASFSTEFMANNNSDANIESTDIQALKTKAQAEGSLRIIVHLEVAHRPTGTLSTAGKQQQAAAIRSARSRLVKSLAKNNFQLTAKYKTVPALALEANGQAIEKLSAHPLVKNITEDHKLAPLLGNSIEQIEAPQLHRAGILGEEQTVAVLDTGIDTSHSVFGGGNRITGEACFSNEDCPDGSSRQIGPGAASPREDSEEHGTHVAGIAVGQKTTNVDTGTAPGANLIAVNVFTRQNGLLFSYESDLLEGIEHILDDSYYGDTEIAAVNMSLGSQTHHSYCDDQNPALTEAFANLHSENIAPVVASGNDGDANAISFPACISDAFAVGATDGGNKIATFSNRHPDMVQLLAPGANIRSAIYSENSNDSAGYKSGTSMAAPHITGSFALLRGAFPDLDSIEEINNVLVKTGKEITDKNGADYYLPRLKRAHTYLEVYLEAENKYSTTGSLDFRISPNPYLPGDGNLNSGDPEKGIYFDQLPKDFKISVYTITGRKVFDVKNPPANHAWIWRPVVDTSGAKIQSGVYLVKVKDLSSGQTGTAKLGIER